MREISCEQVGHDWEVYDAVVNSETVKAGYCVKCGFDTHNQYQEASLGITELDSLDPEEQIRLQGF